jgi:hypothetical protein
VNILDNYLTSSVHANIVVWFYVNCLRWYQRLPHRNYSRYTSEMLTKSRGCQFTQQALAALALADWIQFL